MNKEKLWEIYLRENPGLSTDPRLTPEGVRRIFNITWNTAYLAGSTDMAQRVQEITEAQAALQSNAADDTDPHALLSALQHFEQTLAAFADIPVKAHKLYVTKKENPKKTNGGGK
jgi:hypothetical protein